MVRFQNLLVYASIAILFFSYPTQAAASIPPPNCFDPKTTSALTFCSDGAMTTSARTSPIAQLACVSGNGCSYGSKISVAQCQNEGQDESGRIQWKCSASLPPQVEFGTTTVSCEGCRNVTDEFKLSGSCGLMYDLLLTETTSYTFHFLNKTTVDVECGPLGCVFGLIVFVFFIVLCLFWFCCACCCSAPRRKSGYRQTPTSYRYQYVELSSTYPYQGGSGYSHHGGGGGNGGGWVGGGGRGGGFGGGGGMGGTRTR